jgi:hypothetical protein
MTSMAQPIQIVWGIAGLAEQARLLPYSTPFIVEFLHDDGITVDLPKHTEADLAHAKDATWILPIFEVLNQVSVAALGQLLANAIERYALETTDTTERPVRILIRQRRPDGTVTEVRIENSMADAAEILRSLQD